MRNNIYKIIICAIALFTGSCSKDFLDTQSPQIDVNDYFTSEKDVNYALTACYTIYSWEDGTSYFQYWVGDVLGHDAYKGGEGAGDQQWMEPLLQFDYSAAGYAAELETPYKNYYVAINRCNRFIENVQLLTEDIISSDRRKEVIAEAKFMRGVYYFELVKMYGPIPLVTTILQENEFKQPKSPVDTIYKQIEKDFADAAIDLPLKGEQETGRATKGSALAYLCKSYIYQQKWAEALVAADSVITSGEYSLETNYADNWLLSNENGRESVFEIQFTKTNNSSLWGDDNQGQMFSIFTRSRNNNDGWGFCCPTQEFVNEFEAADSIRLHSTVIFDGDTLWKGTADEEIADNQFTTCIDRYMSKKYQLPLSEQGDMSDDPLNWKVIRYAEVLLWRAEAAYHTGGDWQTYLQQIRDRVGLGLSPYLSDPLKAIYHERRVELGMEGHRLWDVIRQGNGENILGSYGYNENTNHYFPVPASQNLSNQY
jgi:starch-binding outer membrane protein, SusD/RagB family